MGTSSTLRTIIIGIIALVIIIDIIIFFIKIVAPLFAGFIVLAILIGVGLWVYGRMKTR
ncbi:MAG: hypothetical protein WBP64_15285 [Nitrososphaeraceae archaeon]